MILLTQDEMQLVDVKFVEIKSDENGYYLFGTTDRFLQIKLGEFKSEEKAKAVLVEIAATSSAIIPEDDELSREVIGTDDFGKKKL